MKAEQIYTGCLAQGAYYTGSNGEAALIDPLREVKSYAEKAEKDSAKIKYALGTPCHADFASGHLDLAKETGVKIVYGPSAQPKFDASIAKDGEDLSMVKVKINVLRTPGHTMESATYLLKDENGKDYAIFPGDTLFIGDVGRPDLAVKTHLTKEDLAGYLYDSLQHKIRTIADEVIVYPGHGGGSACGKNMSRKTVSATGNQRKFNYALRAGLTKEQFIKESTEGLLPSPVYFPQKVMMDKEGYESIGEALHRGLQALPPEAFEAAANEKGALVSDTRMPEVFAAGRIPNSINIGIDGNFAPRAGALLQDIRQPVLIVAEHGREEEIVTRPARVRCDHAIGYLKGGFNVWKNAGKEADAIAIIPDTEFAKKYQAAPLEVIDVRKPDEFAAGHEVNALNIPFDYTNDHMSEFENDRTLYLHCTGGYRSMVAASILKARGFERTVNVEGGYKAISEGARTKNQTLFFEPL